MKNFNKSCLILFALICILPSIQVYAQTQPLVDAVNSGFEVSGTTVMVEHTTANQDNRLMIVSVSSRGRLVSTVTYGGIPLDLLGSETSNSDAYTFLYALISPPVGLDTVIVTFTSSLGGNNAGIVGVTTYYNTDPINPIRSYASMPGNNSTPTLNVPSATDELVHDVMAQRQETTNSAGAGQTIRWNIDSGGEAKGAGSTKAGAPGSVTMTWNLGGSNRWSMSGISIRPTPDSDLGITKTVNNSAPYAGQTITFTVTASNSGPDTAKQVIIDDLLPSGYTYVSSVAGAGTYNAGTGIWDLGTVNPGFSTMLTIQVKVKPSGTYTNTANISGSVVDTNNTNDSASATITLCGAGGTAPIFK